MKRGEISLYIVTVTFTVSIILNIICFTTFLPAPQPDELRDFNSMIELKTFLALSSIDQREYTDTYKCTKFTRDLIEEARLCGYRMGSFNDWDANHMMCFAYVNGILYVVEPQTDGIEHAIRVN